MNKIIALLGFLIFSSNTSLLYANNLDDWKTLTNESTKLSAQKQYEHALQLSNQALRIAEQEPRDQTVRRVTSLIQVARLHQYLNQFPQAESYFSRAIRFQAQATPADRHSLDRNLLFLARLYSVQGDIETAEPIISATLERLEKLDGPNNGSLMAPLGLLGNMYLIHGRTQLAASALLRALAINEKLKIQIGNELKNSLINLAVEYRKTNMLDESIDIEKRVNAFSTSMSENGWNMSKPYVNFSRCGPEYPRAALRAELTGAILLKVLIDVDGQLLEKEILKSTGWKLLDYAVLKTIAECQHTPAIRDGNPVREWAKLQYIWKLDNNNPLIPPYELIQGSCLPSDKFTLAENDDLKSTIRMAFSIDSDGKPTKIEIIDGSSSDDSATDLAAIKLAASCKFKKSNTGGKSTSTTAYIRFHWNTKL